MSDHKITLKINNAKETLDTLQFNTAGTGAVRVQAQADVNYELIDEATGFGPENITVKRVGKDLQITFEGSNIDEPDLIIENYYAEDGVSNLVVGQHENGHFYPYVPESGQTNEAISLLAEEVFAGQALGGEAVVNPLWVFNPMWLLALLPIAAIAAVAGSSGSDMTTPPPPPPRLSRCVPL
ncbi:hypothetical protein LVJ83_10735 [Uruburuella testudinis]|uniref:Uncharacterized protein n=1 Tax=Uruburuella testudinis TaxID=1282863 RepID=A0ABY4DQU5_9NEIS|nr:hypothetical protein [Uruburuella testudinis]UOO81423.1 hypothetical protein LVJ83_10735 [Uruburuella testudinis]